MKVRCVDGLVDGLTKEKEYDITHIFIRKDGILYGLIDNYGTYNEFKAERFEFVEDKKIDILVQGCGVAVSVLLN